MCRRYASRRGVDLHELPWYHAFGCFKVAVILEGIHYRHAAGQTLGPGFERIGDHVAPLVDLGHRALERTTAR